MVTPKDEAEQGLCRPTAPETTAEKSPPAADSGMLMLPKEKTVTVSQAMALCCRPTTACHSGRGFAETKAAEITMRVRSPAATITEFLDLALLCTGDVRFWLRNNSSVPEHVLCSRGRCTSGATTRQRRSSVATGTLVLLAGRASIGVHLCRGCRLRQAGTPVLFLRSSLVGRSVAGASRQPCWRPTKRGANGVQKH
ncbi:hypothetical protein HPB51_003721 [Rhipicephalus microplus]|uniref:Uncharacterized protein n=1 Tax=Rhipicephalus microplus TaxID=6941 RepID=A0A9J6DSC7_RHIMP|nr:hypothetical protein HPB51_003721 [Rhipicephalus microplus]